jgi:hypothetical protein
MQRRATKVNFKGTVERRDDATGLLTEAGDFVIVKRGVPRLMILLCPCGCGDDLLINLDKRAGPAWRYYIKSQRHSLFPSYWRDTECQSHFVVWGDHVYWFSGRDEEDDNWLVDDEIEKTVLAALKDDEFVHYIDLADECGLIPWECLQACKQLVKSKLCSVGTGVNKGCFKKYSHSER